MNLITAWRNSIVSCLTGTTSVGTRVYTNYHYPNHSDGNWINVSTGDTEGERDPGSYSTGKIFEISQYYIIDVCVLSNENTEDIAEEISAEVIREIFKDEFFNNSAGGTDYMGTTSKYSEKTNRKMLIKSMLFLVRGTVSRGNIII